MITVTAAVIAQDGRFLICKRPRGKNHGGLWEFPGGKVENGETLNSCIIRECMEELGIQVDPTEILAKVRNGEHEIVFIRCSIASGNIILNEHEDHRWITADETGMYEFCPGDRAALGMMKIL